MTAPAAPWPPAFAGTPAVTVIERALAAGRLSPSLLMAGDDAEGLSAAGLALADRILNRGGGRPFPAAVHPDCHQVRPVGKLRVIKADMVRELIATLNVTGSLSRFKVGLIHDADRFHPAAANIFLKTLEEPPPDTTLLLLSSRPYALLPTIRSRVLHFRFPGLATALQTEGWAAWLEDYRAWLRQLGPTISPGAGVADPLFAMYGLVARFGQILEQGAAADHARRQATLPAALGAEELEAIESEAAVGLRLRMLTAIEAATRQHARELIQAGDDAAGRLLPAATAVLERVAGLLRVNLNELTALEDFLLASLRIWSRR